MIVPSQSVYVPDITGVGAESTLPQTSSTTGNEGATASASHSIVLAISTGPPASSGGVVISMVYVYTHSNSRPEQSSYV